MLLQRQGDLIAFFKKKSACRYHRQEPASPDLVVTMCTGNNSWFRQGSVRSAKLPLGIPSRNTILLG